MLLAMATLYAPAQTNGSNSPYSRFGLGSLKDQSQGFNKAMSGVALGFRDGNRINMQNPASYSAIDSLSFIFVVGLTLQNVNFKSGGNSINAHNTTLDYINAGFRLCPGLGFSFGFIPFSSIGYDFSESKYLGDHFNSGSTMTYTNSYTGDGLKIAEIIAKGPLTLADTKIKPGCIIEKINEKPIKSGENYYPLLSGKAGKKVLLSVYNPATKERFEEQVKPISYGEQSNLLYKRWVENCRKKVD